MRDQKKKTHKCKRQKKDSGPTDSSGFRNKNNRPDSWPGWASSASRALERGADGAFKLSVNDNSHGFYFTIRIVTILSLFGSMETDGSIPVGLVDNSLRFGGQFSGKHFPTSCYVLEKKQVTTVFYADLFVCKICAMTTNGKNSQIGTGLWCGIVYGGTAALALLAIRRNDKAM